MILKHATQNSIYCFIIKNTLPLEDEFVEVLSKFMGPKDGDYIAGYDDGDESIYITYVDKYKIDKMVEFFQKHNALVSFQKIDNIVDFLNSEQKYLLLYELNNDILDNYIEHNISIDNILERICDNCMEYLLPVEVKMLNKKTSEMVSLV